MKLGPPTPEFLEELRERARRVGWSCGDYIEIVSFIQVMYKRAGLPVPDMTPYPEKENQ